ncbi:hypothetical protein DPMN_190147 [Dreissena polymorpha]|uniref:Uncharacterized protein n=1 Tax=Dreissena polymorpha TaxID=45954 RepID=A0A9D4DU34_DREPO|nr:hypothetical protein DPMN_190147 [Dreissena polymorpha]
MLSGVTKDPEAARAGDVTPAGGPSNTGGSTLQDPVATASKTVHTGNRSAELPYSSR